MVVAAFLVYYTIRAAVVSQAGTALINAYEIIELERALGMYWELEMQSWILEWELLIRAMNWVYFWGHMPVIIPFAIWLWVRHRPTYILARNAFLAAGFIAVIMYAMYPLAPPRLVPFEGYVDTMALYNQASYQAQETRAFVNPFAAMPSLHFGWAMLLGGAVAWVGRRNPVATVFGIAWPTAMFFTIVLTGNHFILDAVAGAIVSLIGLGVAVAVHWMQPGLRAWVREQVPALDHAMRAEGAEQ